MQKKQHIQCLVNFSPVTETILTKLFIAVSLYTTPVATMTSLKKHTASDQKLEAEKAWEHLFYANVASFPGSFDY